MAADVAAFASALEKAYGNFSTVEMQLDPKDAKQPGERGRAQYLEQRFQDQLQRARAAFLQEFRNHSVVVECEVRKIREELTKSLEEKYGERMELLRRQNSESEALIEKLREEVAHVKNLVTAQESYLVAVRHHKAREDKHGAEIRQLQQQLEDKTEENSGLSHQLTCRDELVAQLSGELSTLETELKRMGGDFAQESRDHDEMVRGLRLEMKQQKELFEERLGTFQEQFEKYRAKAQAELQVQEIMNARRAEALRQMEEERQRLAKARAKPSQRIGSAAPVPNPMTAVTQPGSASAEAVQMPMLAAPPGSAGQSVQMPMLGSAAASSSAAAGSSMPPVAGAYPQAGGATGLPLAIAPDGEVGEAQCEPYSLAKDTRYRVDDMGMDTAWRDYRLNDSQSTLTARRQAMPKFRVERARKASSAGPHAPVATEENLRPQPRPLRPVPLRQVELAAPQSAR